MTYPPPAPPSGAPAKTAVFTIVSLNYVAFAQTLMESLRATHPDWDRFVLIVDKRDPMPDLGALFSSVLVEDLPLPLKNEFLFRYGIMELNTAVKPWMFERLRGLGYRRIVYLDPDILVTDRFEDVERLLNGGATGVLLPHLTAPIDDGRYPGEIDIMRAGTYNLGFLALGDTPAVDPFIKWWQRKLEFEAASDVERGLFTDQKWMDLAPALFEGFAVLRDPGYNVAYWNLPHRPVARTTNGWTAAGRPLRFFHFSGFDPENPKPFSKHQDRFTLDTIGPARELALEYAALVLGHDHAGWRAIPYAYGTFDDGTPIPEPIRALYRENANLRARAGDNPFANAPAFILGEVDGLPAILRGAWLKYPHLRKVFPDPLGSSRRSFYAWFVDAGADEMRVPKAFVEPVRRALVSFLASEGISLEDVSHAITSGSIWTRLLVKVHVAVRGGRPSVVRLMQYREVTGPVQLLRLVTARLLRTRWARALGVPERQPAERTTGPLRLTPIQWVAARHTAQFWGLFESPDRDVWWMGRQAQFIIDNPAGTVLRLRGIHPAEMHRLASGRPELTINITVDGEPRGSVMLAELGPFDVSVDLGALPINRPAVLGLAPERSCVPRELGLGEDARALSVQIASVEVGGATVFSAAHPEARTAPRTLGAPGVNVIGYARSEHGVGQSLRSFVAALDAAGIASSIIDFNVGNLSRTEDRTLEARLVTEPAHRINVFHINADQMPVAELHLPTHTFEYFNIGFWHWELPELPDEYLTGFRRLNEVWVPSAFVQDAVSKKSPVPVVRMPHAIRFSTSPDASRRRFGLPDDRFLFLMMYDFSSLQERKNPAAVLEAFDRAFARDGAGAALVVKTQNAHHHPQDLAELQARLSGRRDVVWINETLSRQDVYDLFAVCDAFVSLHRSEGWGLGPIEAMYLGKPVVATNWSGNVDFMRQDNSLPVNYRLVTIERDVGPYRAGQTWADPDVEHAAWLMRRIVQDGELRARISREASRTAHEDFSPEVIGRRIRARLEYVQSVLDNR
ncbi:MAG TPA: glycosyltransferase family 4 protein [Vicinamibacterales bacterium]|nr:glycosyltransferase family 4 protein [Vicinamibacterales bacterium]